MNNDTGSVMERYLTPIALLLAALIVAGAIVFGGGKGGDSTDKKGAVAVDVKNINVENDPYIGDKNAPATMVLFYDYQCPFCKQFELGVNPKLIANYVDKGKLKIVFKDFQFLGQDSLDAAVFGRAVWESQPDKFYPWFVAMFNAQDDEGDQGFGDMASIEKLSASVPGLDVAKVKALVAKNRTKYEDAIKQDYTEGVAVSVNGTPTAIVGKKLFTAMSADQFYAGISAEVDAETK